MNAFAPFPFALSWNAQELADAVPQRLSDTYAFAPETAMADARRMVTSRRRTTYVAPASLRLFHIGG